jgi:hypothetical protein
MYDEKKYNDLISKYGHYSSWAIWNNEEPGDTGIIDKNIDQLHSRYVLLGLNMSHPLTCKPWLNFHDNTHARKIRYACNDTKLRGSYITDIFKGITNPSSGDFLKNVSEDVIKDNVDFFNQEMKDIGINSDSQFIVFGTQTSFIAQCFNKYFRQNFNNNVVFYYHYSYYVLTDKEWVEGLWKIMEIKNSFSKR